MGPRADILAGWLVEPVERLEDMEPLDEDLWERPYSGGRLLLRRNAAELLRGERTPLRRGGDAFREFGLKPFVMGRGILTLGTFRSDCPNSENSW